MRNVIRKTSVAFATLVILGIFASCDNRAKKETKQVAETVEISAFDNAQLEDVATQEPIVFITGIDKSNSDFYKNARTYFKEKNLKIVEGAYSLEEIITWMNSNGDSKPFGEVHIVNYNNPFTGMSLETVVNGETVTAETLRKNITQGKLPSLKSVVNRNTNIIFHSQGLAENTELMKTIKDAFVANETPNIVATQYYNVFGGEFKKHYLAQPYYVFYPTAHSPGKIDLSKEIARKYSEEKEINWFDALNNEEERYVGEAYTQQFNVPVKFELDYHNSDEAIPTFTMQEEIMDFIEEMPELQREIKALNIPVDKFRWTWDIVNSQLIIKGKTTVLTVLKPVTKPYGDLEHVEPDTKNKRLYAMK